MRLILMFLLGMLLAVIPTSIFVYKQTGAQVLGERVEETTPTPTETPIPTPRPTPKPTATPMSTPAPVFPKISSEEINNLIGRFASQYGVDPNFLRHIAICESGFNPAAVNGAYVGLYQFGPVTWRNNRVAIGEDPNINLRYSAEESIQTAAYLLSTKGVGFWPNCRP